jgi:meso-butanediol dehydrogenase / (S,S)-butanediol dehydrogenase / diacetyl reductase
MMPGPREEIAVISGGASGIGLATAKRLVARGAAIAVLDRSEAAVETAVAALEDDGAEVLGLVGDVSVDDDVEAACLRIDEHFGGMHTVIACAGVDGVGEIHSLDEALWDQCIAVNLKGVFLLARHTLPRMLAGGGGSFLAVSSAAGVRGLAGNGAYSAAKHGVVGLVKTMALDYGGRGIRANAVCPGFTETPMVETYFRDLAPPGEREKRLAHIPIGRFARPDEVADLIAHLTSDKAGFTNGTVQVLDGGAYAGYWWREER